MRVCDVLLDSFHFGGGNTTAEALATGIPIVTLPGAYMRGRFTYAWLRRIGVEEGIATSEEDFVGRALRFGRDGGLRAAVRHATKANGPLAYEDLGSVRAFELELIKSVEMRQL
jgi:predicted O-linked N-acetylglucosamine transferase (SPINDLY family)